MSETATEQAEIKAHAAPARQDAETPLESLSSICVVLSILLFVMTFVFQNYVIPSPSMEKTLLVGDHVVVDRVTLAPRTRWAFFMPYRDVRRGDVIVFMKPNPETPDLVLVKRAIAIAGDRIHLSHGVVYLNGVAQNEPYVNTPPPGDGYDPVRDNFPAQGAPPSSLTTASWVDELPSHIDGADLVVPPGKVFALGDNRTESADGRFWGFVPRENILGRPLFNYWSFAGPEAEVDSGQATLGTRVGSFFTTALHFFDKTRWQRTGHIIR